jgi:hypothetical protein
MKSTKNSIFLNGLILFIPTITLAEPVYVKCVMSTTAASDLGKIFDESTGSKNEFSVKLDEDSGKITHTITSKALTDFTRFNCEGFFSASTISYAYNFTILEEIEKNVLTESYEIDRSNLNVKMISYLTGTMNGFIGDIEVMRKEGTCEVEEVKKNKI